MELVNLLYAEEAGISAAAMPQILERMALLLAPFAPYLAQEMWEELGHEGPIFRQSWPAFDPQLAKEEEAEVVVQVNGKLRSRISVPFGMIEDELIARAMADEKIKLGIEGKQIVKTVVVPDKLVNIVVK
jgi:leucyl-tRNA synthetase